MDLLLIALVVVGVIAAVVALSRDRRADYEDPVSLESSRASRVPSAVGRTREE